MNPHDQGNQKYALIRKIMSHFMPLPEKFCGYCLNKQNNENAYNHGKHNIPWPKTNCAIL